MYLSGAYDVPGRLRCASVEVVSRGNGSVKVARGTQVPFVVGVRAVKNDALE